MGAIASSATKHASLEIMTAEAVAEKLDRECLKASSPLMARATALLLCAAIVLRVLRTRIILAISREVATDGVGIVTELGITLLPRVSEICVSSRKSSTRSPPLLRAGLGAVALYPIW